MKFSKVQLSDVPFPFLKIEIGVDDMAMATRTAFLKSQQTMDFDQAGKGRSALTKFDRQLQGVLAEMATESFLHETFKDIARVKVVRYDSVRTDSFRSPKGEFDIKLVLLDEELKTTVKEFVFEVRSSKFQKDIDTSQMYRHKIIGAYTNDVKQNEKMSDFFIKPVFQVSCDLKKEDALLHSIARGDLKFLMLGGCSRNAMKTLATVETLGQGTTKYNLVEINIDRSILMFAKNLRSFILEQLQLCKKVYLNTKIMKP